MLSFALPPYLGYRQRLQRLASPGLGCPSRFYFGNFAPPVERNNNLESSILFPWRHSRLFSYSDPALCELCLAGSQEAWEVLLTRYQNLIYSIPLKFHLNEDEAADIFQAVALDLYTSLEKLRQRERLQPWLISVTRHSCLRYKEKRELEPLSAEEMEAVVEALPDPRGEAEQWLLEVEEENILRQTIARASRRCQELILWLFYSDPVPQYREVAERLGVAKDSVGFIRERCLKKLRALLGKAGFSRRSWKKNPLLKPREEDV